jgi:hypothetical protein
MRVIIKRIGDKGKTGSVTEICNFFIHVIIDNENTGVVKFRHHEVIIIKLDEVIADKKNSLETMKRVKNGILNNSNKKYSLDSVEETIERLVREIYLLETVYVENYTSYLEVVK